MALEHTLKGSAMDFSPKNDRRFQAIMSAIVEGTVAPKPLLLAGKKDDDEPLSAQEIEGLFNRRVDFFITCCNIWVRYDCDTVQPNTFMYGGRVVQAHSRDERRQSLERLNVLRNTPRVQRFLEEHQDFFMKIDGELIKLYAEAKRNSVWPQ